jgi:hypothetical protein
MASLHVVEPIMGDLMIGGKRREVADHTGGDK